MFYSCSIIAILVSKIVLSDIFGILSTRHNAISAGYCIAGPPEPREKYRPLGFSDEKKKK
jgi:hypothetical protein